MKKILLLALTVTIFAGCTFGDAFIDRKGAHNGLINNLNSLSDAEAKFFDEYYILVDDADTTAVLAAYDEFEKEVMELDAYMKETEFGSTQQFYVTDYNETYGPFVEDYLAYAKVFADKVEKEGYTYEAFEPYFADLDTYTSGFADVHITYGEAVDANAGVY